VKLKLDENLGRSARDALAGGGHEVTTVPDQSLRSAPGDRLSAALIGQGTIPSCRT
jgi:hypothetical protein